ncbi:MAG: serpin family protein [Myxococcota bacterium]
MLRSSVVVAVLLVACGPEPREVSAPDGDIGVAVAATNAFTWDAYVQLVGDSDEDNLFVSPFSMHAALSMVLAGAEGETEAEMADVLHVSDESAHHPGLGALIRDLSEARRRPYTLSVANRIWGQDSVVWEEPFLAVNRDNYGVEVELRDIVGNPERTRRDVNEWVAGRTQDRIPELFAPGQISDRTVMVLANAIYFLADWKDPFDVENTRPADFTTLEGEVVQVETMHRTDPSRHHVADGFEVLGMPYESDEVAMWVVLPDLDSSLPELEAQLDVETLTAAFERAESVSVELALPKLEARTRLQLAPALSAMGMPLAFLEQADFSGMSKDAPLLIDEAVHEAYVRVDEEGTEAAAATGVGIRALSAEPEPIAFTVDRPYLFAIRDELTGAVLFMGRVTHPADVLPADG